MTGIHYRHVAHEAMMETRYSHGIEYVLLSHVPARLELEIKAASSLCKIKLGIEYVTRKLTGRSKEKKEKKIRSKARVLVNFNHVCVCVSFNHVWVCVCQCFVQSCMGVCMSVFCSIMQV